MIVSQSKNMKINPLKHLVKNYTKHKMLIRMQRLFLKAKVHQLLVQDLQDQDLKLKEVNKLALVQVIKIIIVHGKIHGDLQLMEMVTLINLVKNGVKIKVCKAVDREVL